MGILNINALLAFIVIRTFAKSANKAQNCSKIDVKIFLLQKYQIS